MTEAADPGFALLAERIAGRTGLDVGAYKDRCLRRRIAVRMRACGVASYGAYVAVLDTRPGEFDALLDALTINVTRFFRNPETWAWVGREALPGLLLAREGRLRAWSAGCASGEEPYTIVMLVAEVLNQLGRPEWLARVQVDATDLDRASLEAATTAEYPPAAFSEADPAVIARWTEPADQGRRRVRQPVRAVVHFRRLDLLREEAPQGAYDLIFCRNVIIYFDRPTQERLMEGFAARLAPDGLLVLGKVETILGTVRQRLHLVEPRERIYRRAG
jgi:chemotaxis methyl-accepting protein methylase